MVHPQHRHNGYGTTLLAEIEQYFPEKRYELFTSTRSKDNIRLYQRMGYKIFEHEAINDELQFLYFQKYNPQFVERNNMQSLEIGKEMYRRAVELINKRYPVGWGGARVVHTANENYFMSVSIDTANSSAILCIETGAMLEAHKYNEKVTHCMCLVRDDENSPYKVLSSCGICQKRLRFWGEDVQVAVATEDDSLLFVSLGEL